jgi:phosphate uptake regulator
MIKELLDLLKDKADLIDLSRSKSLSMLNTSKEMVILVFNALNISTSQNLKSSISKIDCTLNEIQKEVRKMVFEHLAISGVKDLVKSLQLFSIVNDIERIGDNAKNLAEVLDYIPTELVISKIYESRFNEIITCTEELFELSIKALEDFDISIAEQVVVKYQNISRLCEEVIKEIVTSEKIAVKKSDLRLLMILRYTKRINAHLRNVAYIIKEPINVVDLVCK